MRSSLCKALFEIFVRSADQAHEKKKNSFLLFKSNMADLKKSLGDIGFILVSVYSRLKNLIYDEIPKVEWEKKYKLNKTHSYTNNSKVQVDRLKELEPGYVQHVFNDHQSPDKISTWVEDTLYYVIMRKK
jgi:hypothetical protein